MVYVVYAEFFREREGGKHVLPVGKQKGGIVGSDDGEDSSESVAIHGKEFLQDPLLHSSIHELLQETLDQGLSKAAIRPRRSCALSGTRPSSHPSLDSSAVI